MSARTLEQALASDEAEIIKMVEELGGIKIPERLRGNIVYPAAQEVCAWLREVLADPATVEVFRIAWHEADARAEIGHRVEAGLAAIAEAVTR